MSQSQDSTRYKAKMTIDKLEWCSIKIVLKEAEGTTNITKVNVIELMK